jgi:hypothetical protein
MKTLELFAGSRSFSKVANDYGFKTYTTDISPYENINQVADIFHFDLDKAITYLGGKPDIIWASPPCETFSIASVSHHWYKDRRAKSKQAKRGLEIIRLTIDIIQYVKPKYWFIENPRGILRKLYILKQYERKTITYCSYGDDRMKPTDIWTNLNWTPKPMCKRSERHLCHHKSYPRGSSDGSYRKMRGQHIPPKLFVEIFETIKEQNND